MRRVAEDWRRQVGKEGTWHWRVVDTGLEPSEDDLEAGEEGEGVEGRTVGIAVWGIHNLPINHLDHEGGYRGEESSRGNDEKKEDSSPPFSPPELRLDALQSLLGPLRAAQPEIMPPSHPPYLMLNQLAVHPSHQGRGIGSLLLNWGLEKADTEGLAVYLTASEAGKRMYDKRGFEVRRVVEWDRAEWGGEGVDRYWCMVRKVGGVKG